MAQWVKNPPAMQETQETWVQSLGQEDPLEEGMTTQSSILAWRIPWTEEPDGLQSMGPQRVRHDWSDWAHTCTRMHMKVLRAILHLLPLQNYSASRSSLVQWGELIRSSRKSIEQSQETLSLSPSSVLSNYVPLDNWLHLSEPQFPICEMGTYPIGYYKNEIMRENLFTPCLVIPTCHSYCCWCEYWWWCQ